MADVHQVISYCLITLDPLFINLYVYRIHYPSIHPGTSSQVAGKEGTPARSSTPQPSIPFFRSSSEAKNPNLRQVTFFYFGYALSFLES